MDIFEKRRPSVESIEARKKFNKFSNVIAFVIMFSFFLLAASICYLIGSIMTDFYDILKWIALGFLVIAIINLIVSIILTIVYFKKKRKV